MADFYEIDFLAVETKKSGDAITLRYELGGEIFIHIIDGGFQETGEAVVNHIHTYYSTSPYIDHVVVTHPDGDHAGGLRTVLSECTVGALWMLRPWLYADVILDSFSNVTSAENLRRHLREVYPNLVALEEIAEERGIPIYEPFQGAQIGAFTVLTPSLSRYLDCVVNSERTPQAKKTAEEALETLVSEMLKATVTKVVNIVKAAWGEEVFSTEGTSAENEMSIVQYAVLCDHRILLTADAGRDGLSEAADFAPNVGLILPGIDRFQVPHHGSRRNVSTEVLDRWLGERLPQRIGDGAGRFSSLISSAKEDEDHPRKAVIRAMIHRGGTVSTTEGANRYWFANISLRDGWSHTDPMPYPDNREA